MALKINSNSNENGNNQNAFIPVVNASGNKRCFGFESVLSAIDQYWVFGKKH